MIDEIYDRHYREARGELHRSFNAVAETIAESFRALHRVQFAAPWSKPERRPLRKEWHRAA